MANTQEREPLMGWVDKRDRQRLVELARTNERSVSAELRVALRAHVQREGFSRESERAAGVGDGARRTA